MASWVFKAFHDGKEPSVKERINEAAKILEKCDKDGDGSIDEVLLPHPRMSHL